MQLSASSLTRRIKRRFNRSSQRLFIPCSPGMEALVHSEAAAILANDAKTFTLQVEHGGVTVVAHVHTIYSLNLWLRAANRVLLRIDEFWADSLPALFNHAQRVPWEAYLGYHSRVRVVAASSRSRLSTGHMLRKTLIDALNRRFQGLRQEIHSTDALENDVPTVYVRVYGDRVTLSIDTSGDHLFQRGYRVSGGQAPIRPTTAAGLLQFSGWRGGTLVDPFCGSGTLLIEGAMLAKGLAPGRNRSFAFEHLPFHNVSVWARIRSTSAPAMNSTSCVFGSDHDAVALQTARANVESAGLNGLIKLRMADAMAILPREVNAAGKTGTLVMNIPYGKRVPIMDSQSEYLKKVLRSFQSRFCGWHIGLIIPRVDLTLNDFMEAPRVLHTQNGGLPISFVRGKLRPC